MDQLSLHIEYLLRKNDFVILPGFGAFINVYTPAHYSAEEGLWYPMTREVRFNPGLSTDDGILTNSYERKYKLSYSDARALLFSDLQYLRQLLEDEGEASIEGVGSILYDSGKPSDFVPVKKSSNINSELGLLPVSIGCDRIVENKTKKVEAEITSACRDIEIRQLNSSDAEDNNSKRKFDTEKNFYVAVNKVFAKIAASVIVFCLLGIIPLFTTDYHRTGEHYASVLPVEKIIDTVQTSANEHQNSDGCQEESEEYLVTLSDKMDEKEKEVAGEVKHRFHLVVGTFRTSEEAELYITQKQNSSGTLSLVPSSTLYRVSVASSDDRSSLIPILNSGEIRAAYAGAWIWEDKSVN